MSNEIEIIRQESELNHKFENLNVKICHLMETQPHKVDLNKFAVSDLDFWMIRAKKYEYYKALGFLAKELNKRNEV